MRVELLSCGPFANQSERNAANAVKTSLLRIDAPGTIYILTNLTHSHSRGQAHEIDMIVIGPGGAVVIEVKHWDAGKLRKPEYFGAAAELILAKSRSIAGRLRELDSSVPYVPAAMLLTRELGSMARNGRQPEHPARVRVYGLKDVQTLCADLVCGCLDSARLAKVLAPRQMAEASSSAKRFGRFDDLKLLSSPEERFARVYMARDPLTGEHVVLHSYDLTTAASAEGYAYAERQARREFEVVRRYQKSPYLPSLVDSWQALPNYGDELFFFTLAESGARSISKAKQDASWTAPERRTFAVSALKALAELTGGSDESEGSLVHRALDPDSVRVRANGKPLFAGWRWARIPDSQTISGEASEQAEWPYAAPEVRAGGLASANPASDVFSLCKVLLEIFSPDDQEDQVIREILTLGLETDLLRRPAAQELLDLLAGSRTAVPMFEVAEPEAEAVSAARWDEDHEFVWQGHRYRVAAVLGQGAIGRTFRLEQLDTYGEPIGSYVGKVALNPELAEAALDAYKKLRAFAQHDGLSNILECNSEWKPNELTALLRWAKGQPLDSVRGEIDFLAELAEVESNESLLLRWLEELLDALYVLHRQGWVHGDLSPGNILLDEDRLIIIDYDLAGPSNQVTRSPGTHLYCSPERRNGAAALERDDVFSLTVALFHVVTNRSPQRDSNGRLPWTESERRDYPKLSRLFDIATATDPEQRFQDAGAMLRWMRREISATDENGPSISAPDLPPPLYPNEVPRVREILQLYPGSRFGNAETRGLDSAFSEDTYVPTDLDTLLPHEIQSGEVSLVILCGNAGDGKTAFLQNLIRSLGGEPPQSSQRVWKGRLVDRPIMINFDGAASWQCNSADMLLDDFFEPFMLGEPNDKPVHLLAVNDGRLLEWIDHAVARSGAPTLLTEQLSAALSGTADSLDPHIRLIELNNRSLVGGLAAGSAEISTIFLDRLVQGLVGGERASEIWAPCLTCTAQGRCPMRKSAYMMGASTDPLILAQGNQFRKGLTEAFQAVHQRNEVHITARELKGALSYILFGLYDCADLHACPDQLLHDPADFAFDPLSERRQGELLRELARLDPALETHARVDRYLLSRGAPDPKHGAPRYRDNTGRSLPLREARRRAYFGWTSAQIAEVAGDCMALTLKDGRHMTEFREYPIKTSLEQGKIKERICRGISRLDALPEAAHRRPGAVPVRIEPRTPTETAFWVAKPIERFSLEAERFGPTDGVETLHRYLRLTYRMSTGIEEHLVVPLDLYALLMDIADGVQILDAISDDVFANLRVFTQRLAQEDARILHAWNPGDEETVHVLGIEIRNSRQVIVLQPENA